MGAFPLNFLDNGYTGNKENMNVANNLYDIILPLVLEKAKQSFN